MNREQLRYPIGRFEFRENYSEKDVQNFIANIANFPEKLSKSVHNLNDDQLDTAYRPDGWTVRQVVHHCGDSHLNCLMRCKLALTEDQPTIKAYSEVEWAKTVDYQFPVESSLKMLEGIHKKLSTLLLNLTPSELELSYYHPEREKLVSMLETIAHYSWHGEHHLAHINQLKEIKGW